MRLRPYIAALDYDTVASWVTDERLHAMWCARRFPYPLTREGFDESLADMAERLGSSAFVATDDAGKVIGFFGYHLDPEKNEGVLKFVIVSPDCRGKGYGRELAALASKYAFEITGAGSIRLAVFTANPAAERCYRSVGFREVSVAENAFSFGDESWGRRSMVLTRE